jgi:hypothetical protein
MSAYASTVAELRDSFTKCLFLGQEPDGDIGAVLSSFARALEARFGLAGCGSLEGLRKLAREAEGPAEDLPEGIFWSALESARMEGSRGKEARERLGKAMSRDTVLLERCFIEMALLDESFAEGRGVSIGLPSWGEVLALAFPEGRNVLADLAPPAELAGLDPASIVAAYAAGRPDGAFRSRAERLRFEAADFLVPGLFDALFERTVPAPERARHPLAESSIVDTQYFVFLKTLVELLACGALASPACGPVFEKCYLAMKAVSQAALRRPGGRDGGRDGGRTSSTDRGLIGLLAALRFPPGLLGARPLDGLSGVVSRFLALIDALCADNEAFVDMEALLPERYSALAESLALVHGEWAAQAGAGADFFEKTAGRFIKAVDRFVKRAADHAADLAAGLAPPPSYVLGGVGAYSAPAAPTAPAVAYAVAGELGGLRFEAAVSAAPDPKEGVIELALRVDVLQEAPSGRFRARLYVEHFDVKELVRDLSVRAEGYSCSFALDPYLRFSYSLELSDERSGESAILFTLDR